jgi:probable rRNA maturation factor
MRALLEHAGVHRASLSIAIVDDRAIRAVNQEHLDHDWSTDVISFPYSEPGDPELSGELVVSAETASVTARQAGVDPRNELALYLVHGLLHLLGHDDSTVAGREAMRRREGELLQAIGIVNTFSAATA